MGTQTAAEGGAEPPSRRRHRERDRHRHRDRLRGWLRERHRRRRPPAPPSRVPPQGTGHRLLVLGVPPCPVGSRRYRGCWGRATLSTEPWPRFGARWQPGGDFGQVL